MKRSVAARFARLSALLALVLAAITGGVYLHRIWVAHAEKKKAPPAPPVDVERQSSGITFSEGDGDHITYTVHASKSTDFRGQDASLLEEVEVTAFGKKGDRHDVMRTSSCRYAKADGSIQCKGDVLMELQSAVDAELSRRQGGLPVGLATVQTSGVTFERATGRAQTVQPVKFTFPNGRGTAIGAVYMSEQGQLRLIRDVWIELDASAAKRPAGRKPLKENAEKEPVQITGSSLQFDREPRTLVLDGPVAAQSSSHDLKAGELKLWMDSTFRVQTMVATPGYRNVLPVVSMHESKGISTLSAERLTSQFSPQGWITTMSAAGKVQGHSPDSSMESETADLDMWPGTNEARLLVLGGNVLLNTRDANTNALRTLRTNALKLDFNDVQPGQHSTLRHGETLSHGTMEWMDAAGARSKLDADKLAVDFGAKGKAQLVMATGGVQTERELKGRPTQHASAANGTILLGPTGEWTRINLHGNVRVKEGDRSAESQEAEVIHDPQTAVLTGKTVVRDASSETHAAKMTFYHDSGKLLAEGNVRSTDFSSKSGNVQLSAGPVNLSSDRLEANSKTGWALYSGHARMWQGASVLEAGSIELLRDSHVLNAVGNVRGVFPQAPPAEATSKQPTLWHLSSGKLSYFDAENRARLEENVVVQSVDQKMRAATLDLYFTKTPDGSSQISRAVGKGGVVVEEGDRRATAETGVYTAEDQRFVLSGGNPTIYDATEGTTVGRELTFYIASDTIIVDSGNGLRTLTRHRVQR
jgi:lipopolysaccharide export system protein LptA